MARRLGVAPATLRTWDRRYGIGPTAHEVGSHRRYSSADVARLEVMRGLTLRGVTPAEAARLARTGEAAPGPGPAGPTGDAAAATAAHAPAAGWDAAVRGLSRAARALDAPAAATLVEAQLRRVGAVATWEQLLVPVLVSIGDRWETTGHGVEVEHLLTEVAMAGFRRAVARQVEPTALRPVLLACAPEEQHSLPLHALAAALAERRVGCRVLGARVPADALAAAVQRTGPSVVFVWSRLAETGDPRLLASVPTIRPGRRLVAGGAGWGDGVPASVTRVDSLAEAVEVVARAATG